MPIVIRNAIKLHVQDLGSGSPVVMLHGLLVGSLATWYFTCAPSLARKHRVVLYDLRGHGMSERTPSGYDVQTMTEDLRAIVDACTSGPVSLVGHSFGALVALRFALDTPGRVAKLALVDAPLPPSQFNEFNAFLERPVDQMLDALPVVLRDALERRGRQARRFLESMIFLSQHSSLFADLRAEPDIADDVLAEIACPTLAVYGSSSSCRPVGDRLMRVVPSLQLVQLDGGHFLPLEVPGPLTDVLERFLDDQ